MEKKSEKNHMYTRARK